jgi:hypothetical protein
MPRGLTAPQKVQIAARVKRPAFFVQMDIAPVERAWNGVGTVTVLGQTWRGVGEYGLVEGVTGSADMRPHQATIGLLGLPGSPPAGAPATSDMLHAARTSNYQGKRITIYLGFTDLQTDLPLFDPVQVFTGLADAMTYNLGQTYSVVLTVESIIGRLRRTNGLRMTTESHNARLGNPTPRDLFFDAQERLMGVARKAVS